VAHAHFSQVCVLKLKSVLRLYHHVPLVASTEFPILSTPKHKPLVFMHCEVTPENFTGHVIDLLFTENEVLFVGTRFLVPTKLVVPTL